MAFRQHQVREGAQPLRIPRSARRRDLGLPDRAIARSRAAATADAGSRRSLRAAPTAVPVLSLLGSPRFEASGASIELPPARWVTLLAYVARCGGWVRREALAALFWPDHDGRRANLNLRQMLQTIARSPAGVAFEREPSRVRWSGATDVDAFERHVDARAWSAAVHTYGGTFLDGIEIDGVAPVQAWIEAERAGLEDRWRTCGLALAEVWLDAGRCHETLALAERLHRTDPFDEASLRLVLRAGVDCGDARRAARAYHQAAAFLEQELGVAPEDETLALASALGLADRDT
jgi:DNA-binding SARP family transcriptional activator